MDNNIYLKSIIFRQINSNEWIVNASQAKPIIVDTNTKNVLSNGKLVAKNFSSEFIDELNNCGFIKKSKNEIDVFYTENNSKVWRLFKLAILLVGALSFVGILSSIFIFGIPLGDKLLSSKVGIGQNITIILLFSIITALIHEMMHVIFGQAWQQKTNYKISLINSVAKVPLSHIWTWSLLGRVTAISSGVIIDMIFLSIFTYLQLFINSWLLPAFCSILWLRIIWQFRINHRCDGQLLLSMILDIPDFEVSYKNKHKYVKVISFIVSMIIFSFWIVPFIFKIFHLI